MLQLNEHECCRHMSLVDSFYVKTIIKHNKNGTQLITEGRGVGRESCL